MKGSLGGHNEEVKTMQKILRLFSKFDIESKRRMLAWFSDKFEYDYKELLKIKTIDNGKSWFTNRDSTEIVQG